VSHGAFHLDVPHICGELIPVEVAWDYYPGSYMNPPENEVHVEYPDHCYKCGIDLNHDTIFQATVDRMENEEQDRGEYVPGDDAEWDDKDYEDGMPF
jgi:hypothetical protein